MGIDVRGALLHWAAYSAEARNPLRLPAFCVRACRSLGGVQRRSSQIAIRIALTHSTPLPFPAQFACALFVLDIAGDGAKSVPDRQKPRQSCCKKPGGPCLRRCWGSSMDGASRGLAFGAGHFRKTRLRLVGPPLLTSKRRCACSSFDDRHYVSSKERSAGTQAVACQAL